MTELTDLESILLSAAAQRDGGSLLPAPENVPSTGTRVTKAIAALAKRGFAEERETTDQAAIHRRDGDVRYGVFITAAGYAAIGVGEGGDVLTVSAPEPEEKVATKKTTKASMVMKLLQREEGATLAELMTATGWLPHTTRAVLTGIRKKGHAVDRNKRGTETCYRIVAVAA